VSLLYFKDIRIGLELEKLALEKKLRNKKPYCKPTQVD